MHVEHVELNDQHIYLGSKNDWSDHLIHMCAEHLVNEDADREHVWIVSDDKAFKAQHAKECVKFCEWAQSLQRVNQGPPCLCCQVVI
jgi:predicted nucleic acid-binding protein